MMPLVAPNAPRVWSRRERCLLIVLGLSLALGLFATRPPRDDRTPAPLPDLRIDPSTAPARVLVALPQVGPGRAGAIVEARESGPYRSVGDMEARVRGIGSVTAESIAPYLRLPDGDSTVPVDAPRHPGP